MLQLCKQTSISCCGCQADKNAMNQRLIRGALAIMSIMVASIVVGGMFVFVGGLSYEWLTTEASPGIALGVIIVSSAIVSAIIVALAHAALRSSLRLPSDVSAGIENPGQFLSCELLKLAQNSPTKLILAALGVGFVLGSSPRLRRSIYRTLVD